MAKKTVAAKKRNVKVDAMFRNKCDLRVGLLSVIASFTQLFGYGVGFLRSII